MQAVLFDMDGVIIDSELIHTKMKIETLAHFGIPCAEEECLPYVGRSAKAFFGDFAKKAGKDIDIAEMIAYKHGIYLDYLKTAPELEPIAGIRELLSDLRFHGFKIGIGSSSVRRSIITALERFGIVDYFECIISGAELPESKPHPAVYLLCAQKLGVQPQACVVVEDATSGIMAAKAAGMKCIAFDNINSGKQDLAEADIIVDSMTKVNAEMVQGLLNS